MQHYNTKQIKLENVWTYKTAAVETLHNHDYPILLFNGDTNTVIFLYCFKLAVRVLAQAFTIPKVCKSSHLKTIVWHTPR